MLTRIVTTALAFALSLPIITAYPVLSVAGTPILQSEQSKPMVTASRARHLVERLPEVQSWLARIAAEKAKGRHHTPHVVVQDEGDHYTVHVYTIEPLRGSYGHTATLGWYDVDK